MIRQATIEDLAELEPCARAFYATSTHLKLFDMGRFVALWSGLLTSGTGAIFCLFDGDKLNGALGGVIYPEAYSELMIAQEFFWFVKEEARGGGVRLYHEFERWAKAKGADVLRMAYLVDSMPGKVEKFYRRAGLQPVEVCYSKELAA